MDEMANTLSIMDNPCHYFQAAKAIQWYDVRGKINISPIALFHWGMEIKH